MTHPSQSPPAPGREEPEAMIQAVLRALKLSRLEPAFYLADKGDDPYREAVDMVLASLAEAGQSCRPGGEGEDVSELLRRMNAQRESFARAIGCPHGAEPLAWAINQLRAYPDVKGALERAVAFIGALPSDDATIAAYEEGRAALASLSTLPEASGWRPDGGKLWSLIRSRLMDISEAIAKADRYEVASALADDAARKLTDQILALPPGEQP